MRLAKLKIYGIDIYTQYAHIYVEKVKAHGYDEVFLAQTTNLSYPISALNPAYEVIMGMQHSNNPGEGNNPKRKFDLTIC